jgi:cytochrome c oxidase cbb3-type subunit 4
MAMAVFVGIVFWAYSKRKKADFEEAGRMAMDDDKPVNDSMNNAASDKGSKLTEE